MFAKFLGQEIKKNKMPSVSICQQNLIYFSNFEQYFRQQLLKILQILESIFQVCFMFYLVTRFPYDYIFTTKITPISTLMTKHKY